MKIVIAAPLFPPEIGGSAPYAKDLATRLAHSHGVTVVAFATHPEEVSGVAIRAISKLLPTPLRILRFLRALIHATPHAEALYVLNGRSTEFVAIIMRIVLRRQFILCLADPRAATSEQQRLIGRLARALAHVVLKEIPHERPEIIPLDPYPHKAFEAYESGWKHHLAEIDALLTHHYDKH